MLCLEFKTLTVFNPQDTLHWHFECYLVKCHLVKSTYLGTKLDDDVAQNLSCYFTGLGTGQWVKDSAASFNFFDLAIE